MDPRPEITLTHLDEAGTAYMVDVTAKTPTVREARATAFVACSEAIVDALRGGSVPKGDVLAVARVAGIAATKKVPELLPLAHVIGVHGARVDLEIVDGAHGRPHGRGDGGTHCRHRGGTGDRRHGQGSGPGRRAERGQGGRQVRGTLRGLGAR